MKEVALEHAKNFGATTVILDRYYIECYCPIFTDFRVIKLTKEKEKVD